MDNVKQNTPSQKPQLTLQKEEGKTAMVVSNVKKINYEAWFKAQSLNNPFPLVTPAGVFFKGAKVE